MQHQVKKGTTPEGDNPEMMGTTLVRENPRNVEWAKGTTSWEENPTNIKCNMGKTPEGEIPSQGQPSKGKTSEEANPRSVASNEGTTPEGENPKVHKVQGTTSEEANPMEGMTSREDSPNIVDSRQGTTSERENPRVEGQTPSRANPPPSTLPLGITPEGTLSFVPPSVLWPSSLPCIQPVSYIAHSSCVASPPLHGVWWGRGVCIPQGGVVGMVHGFRACHMIRASMAPPLATGEGGPRERGP